MVGEHDAACTHANGTCICRDVPDDHCGRGAGDSDHVVVLSQPVTMIMPSLRMLREVTRVPQSISSGRPFRNKSEIENRYGGHARRLNIFPVPATNPYQVGPGA